MTRFINRKSIKGLTLKEEDPIYLLRKNIKIWCPNSKLDYTKFRLFKIKVVKGLVTFILDLLKDIKIHTIFYKSLLKLILKNTILAILVKINKELENNEYKVEDVLNRKLIYRTLYYLIK